MVKINTQFKVFKNLLTNSTMLLIIALFSLTHSYGQYPATNHGNSSDASISTVIIEDNLGNQIYAKKDFFNGAAPVRRTLFGSASNPAFTLGPGNKYTIRVNCTSMGDDDGTASFGIWADFNDDKDFNDDGESLTQAVSWRDAVPNGTRGVRPTATRNLTFTVPCDAAASFVLRLRSADYNALTSAGGRATDGETEDFYIDIAPLTNPLPNFVMPDSAFVGTPVRFINANSFQGYLSHDWTIDTFKYTSANVTHVFDVNGNYNVKLVSTNCLGSDSIAKNIKIITPQAPPVSDFVADKSVYEIFESVQLTDLSNNGATYWNWMFVNPTSNDTIDGDDIAALRGGDPYVNKNPLVITGNFFGAVPIGVWDVYLTASNIVGAGVEKPKIGYVTVQRSSYNMGAGTSLPANVIGVSAGTIYDDGGPTGNYGINKTTEALIAPCGAQSVTLEFTSFNLRTNANLKIYDGVNALGTPLHTGNGFTQGNAPTGPITASSGALYMLWTSTTGTTASGFAANWTSVAGTAAAPVPFYTYPSTTLYNAVAVDFENTSLNAEGSTKFEWTLSGPENSSAVTRDFSYTFLTNGVYTLDLKVTACDGRTSTARETFTVVSPNTPTNLDFVANTQRPSIGGDVTFTATSDKANNWEWIFFPNDGTNVTANAPSATTSNVRSFKFNTPGVYTVQCRAYNSVDEAGSEATVVKTAYVLVVSPCTPVVGLTTSEDVGINYISITNPNTGDKFENTSGSGVEYTDYTDLGTTSLNFGGTYNFEIKRNTNVNAMNRKIWVDWNVDGDFDDAGELVATEASANTLSWMGSFVVPSIDLAFASPTRMRVGVSYNSDDNEPCGASTNVMVNRIGEFEDYSIQVVNDGDMPVITLIDADTLYIEQVATQADVNYVSPGATANDPSQGDITANVKMSSDVDQTNLGVY